MWRLCRCFLVCGFLFPARGFGAAADQVSEGDLQARVDEIIKAAYQTAGQEFPCKVGTRGKARMLRYQQVDACLNDAYNRVDWDAVSEQIQKLRRESGYSVMDISAAVETSLTKHAITYNKVFAVKNIEALLPLTNSVLKFLPPESLMDFPVFDQSGQQIGKFAGVYSYEKSGALIAGSTYKISVFQYLDPKGEVQTASGSGRLLFDSYGVPWKGALAQPGFRLPADRLKIRG